MDSDGRKRHPTTARRAGRGDSEECRTELSTPISRAGIVGTEHLEQVDEPLAVVVVELHRGQQRSQRSFDIIHRLTTGAGERPEMPGGRALGNLVE